MSRSTRPQSPAQASGTSSPASADGPTPCASPAGQTMLRFGPDPALASHSAEPVPGAASTTRATFGLHGSGSSASAALQSSLGSRLRAATGLGGSMLFLLTWKTRATPLRRRIFALRARARRTSGSASSSWPSPTRMDGQSAARHGYMIKGRPGTSLLDAARLAGWATPVATEIGNTIENYRAMKRNMRSGPRTAITHPALQAQLAMRGENATGSHAPTGSAGQLNPEHSRWLMGFPRAWDACAGTGTRSSRK